MEKIYNKTMIIFRSSIHRGHWQTG